MGRHRWRSARRALNPEHPHQQWYRAERGHLLPEPRGCQSVSTMRYSGCGAGSVWIEVASADRPCSIICLIMYGAPDAGKVIVLMGSGADGSRGDHATTSFRPAAQRFGAGEGSLVPPVCPEEHLSMHYPSLGQVASRCWTAPKSRARAGEPLHAGCHRSTALLKAVSGCCLHRRPLRPRCSKEFTPSMINAVYDNLAACESRRNVSP